MSRRTGLAVLVRVQRSVALNQAPRSARASRSGDVFPPGKQRSLTFYSRDLVDQPRESSHPFADLIRADCAIAEHESLGF